MKVVFDFDNPEDREDYELYKQSKEMYSFIWDMYIYLHTQTKLEEPHKPDTPYEIYEKFWELLKDNNLQNLI